MTRRRAGKPLVHAIVPVNLLKRSKVRLASLLDPTHREQLTLVMFGNVLEALKKSKEIRDVAVISADPRIRSITRRRGAQFLWETKRRGLNRALRTALEESEDGPVVIVHADLPLLTSHDIGKLVARSKGYDLAIVPCKNLSGTNALLMNRPNSIPLAFGKGSFRKHVSLARKRRVRYKIVRLTGIGFDVDEPRDVRWLIHQRRQTETQRFLRKLQLESSFALGGS